MVFFSLFLGVDSGWTSEIMIVMMKWSERVRHTESNHVCELRFDSGVTLRRRRSLGCELQ